MKNIIQSILVLSLVAFFTGCEKDSNGRMPNDIKDSNVGVLIVNESDPFINVSNPGDYEMSVDVDLLFEGDFQNLEVVVVMNGNYDEQNVLQTVTSVPQTLTISSQDLVDAIPGLNSTAEIQEGDVFDVFTNITLTDGTKIPGFDENGVTTNAPSVANIIGVLKNGAANVVIPVPCEFNIDDYLGVVNVEEFWAPDLYQYQGEVKLDPDYTGDNIGLTITGLWDGTWELDIEVSTYDYSIVGNPDAQPMAAEVFGYSNPVWSNIYGTVQTCDGALVVNIGSFCVDAGCFGGMPITYTLTKAEDAGTKALNADLTPVPVKAKRTIE